MGKKVYQTTKKKKSKSMAQVIVLITAVIFVGALLLILFTREDNSTEKVDISIENQPIIGEESAEITIVEFGDFLCPSCGYWASDVYPELYEKYIKTGDVKLAYVNVLGHGQASTVASVAGETIYNMYPENYWDFHKELFAKQPEGAHDTSWLTEDVLLGVAEDTIPSFDEAQFLEKYATEEMAEQVSLDMELVQNLEVEATPTIFVNGIEVGSPMSFDEIEKVIESELGE